MRTAFTLRTSLAAAALVAGGLLATAGAASAAPPTEPPTQPIEIDLQQIMETLTPEQIACIAQAGADLAADPNSAVQVLTDCGVSLDQLATLVPGGESLDPAVSSEVGSDDGTVDPAAVAAVLAAAGLDATDLTCIGAGLDAAVTGDDAEALTILQGCGISLAEILQGLVAAGASAPVPAVDTPATPASTVAGVPADDAINNMVTDMLASMGIELSPDQIACFTNAVTTGGINSSDTGAVMTLLSECGISLTDMMPSG